MDFSERDKQENGYINQLISKDEMLRYISISVVNGRIRVREFRTTKINGLWDDRKSNKFLKSVKEYHGGEWHREMTSIVKRYFHLHGWTVFDEPTLNYGRADLGVSNLNIDEKGSFFVEIGTVSLFKVWVNLSSMLNTKFLFIPSVYSVIEVQTFEN